MNNLLRKIDHKSHYIWNSIFLNHTFRSFGKKSFIYKPLQLDNVQNIAIGNEVYVAEHAWMFCDKGAIDGLFIDDKTVVGHFAHIVAFKMVHIEKSVLIADRVFISDCTHDYENVALPIIEGKVRVLKPVVIGEGSWLGENVCICGASIGKHCVVGANSVVTNDIPDYCVAVGSPAKIVKKYNFETRNWEVLK